MAGRKRMMYLVKQAAQTEADEALRSHIVVLRLDGRHDELGDEAMQHRVLLQCLRGHLLISTASPGIGAKGTHTHDPLE